MKKLDLAVLTLLILAILYFWTLPIQENSALFGEGDAAWHYSIGHHIATSDMSITKLPDFIGFWYYNYNPALGVNAVEYLPSNHINYAFMEVVGGHDFIPVNIFKGITSALATLAVFFLIRKLYGLFPATVAAFGTLFGFNSFQTFGFGQQPTLISMVFAPIVLYAAYKYLTSFYEGKEKIIYAYVLGFLLIAQWLLHIQGMFTVLMIIPFVIFMTIKYKKLPISKSNWKHALVLLVVFALVAAPFWLVYFGLETDFSSESKQPLSRLLQWTPSGDYAPGSYPPMYFDTGAAFTTLLLPFLAIGLFFLLMRRSNKDLLILSWIIGVYLTLHMDVLIGASPPRIARMIPFQTPLVYSVIGIGAFYAPNLLGGALKKHVRQIAGIALCIIAIFVIYHHVSTESVLPEYELTQIDFMKSTYQGISRMTPEQEKAAYWIRDNLPEDAYIMAYGTLRQTYSKTRFIYALSGRYIAVTDLGFTSRNITPTHYLFDYEYIALTGNQEEVNKVLQIEQSIQNHSSLIYSNDQGIIKVYEIER